MREWAGDFGDRRVRITMSERDRPDDSQAQAAGVDVTLIDEILRLTVRQGTCAGATSANSSVRATGPRSATLASMRRLLPR